MQVRAGHPYRSLASMVRPYRGRILAAAAFNVVKDSPVWLVPVFTATIIDTVVAGHDVARLWLFVGLTILVLAQNYPNHLLYVRMYSTVYRSVAEDLRNGLTQHLQGLSIGFHTRRSASIIQNKVVRDVENIELLMQQVFPIVAISTSILVGSVTVTALQAPAFLIVFALTVPLAGVLVAGMRTRAARRNEGFRVEMENLSATVGEMAALIPITRAHGVESTAARRVAVTADQVKRAGMELDRLNGRFETTSWVSFNVLAACCLGLAGWTSMTGLLAVSPGQVVLLSIYFGTLTSAITQLVGLTPVFSKGVESIRSIAEVLEDPDVERNEGKAIPGELVGRIAFERVSFTFPDSAAETLSDLNLRIEPGETVAFVGASGSGKSTAINLILGFLRPTRGRIIIDGTDMESLDMRSVRRFMSVVPQESVLFEGTILENIAYGLDHVEPARAMRALADANALDIIDAMPDGWDTTVGPRGARLSGGQRQRLAIARALLRDPSVLVLDEATSALDGRSEALVQDALSTLMAGRTSLVVAHRLSTVRTADRIVVLDRGRIAEIGNHAQLIAMNGVYSRMHQHSG